MKPDKKTVLFNLSIVFSVAGIILSLIALLFSFIADMDIKTKIIGFVLLCSLSANLASALYSKKNYAKQVK